MEYSRLAGNDLQTRYTELLLREDPMSRGFGHGISSNGWTARPWHLDERLHEVYWTVSEGIRFLNQTRDPSCPFFLTVNFCGPHPPFVPPAFYLDRYLRMELPAPAIGDWAEAPARHGLGLGVDSDRTELTGEALRICLAGYYANINYIDDQIHRLFRWGGKTLRKNTVVIYTSDHGEMLGDHYFFKKALPYEGSARIPLLIRGTPDLGFTPGDIIEAPVSLPDLMPTLLELAGCDIPPSVEGKSLLPFLRGKKDVPWRPYLHGEHSWCYRPEQANHFLTDGRQKSIWFSQTGREQFFRLDEDPFECLDLIDAPEHARSIALWRGRMIETLNGRPEGFVENHQLVAGKPHVPLIPDASDIVTSGNKQEAKHE